MFSILPKGCSGGLENSFGPAPTLLTRISIFPNWSMVSLTTAMMVSGFVMSPGLGMACPPSASISEAHWFAVSSLKELTITVAPSSPRAFAIPLPMPLPAAEIIAIFSPVSC